MLLRLFACLRGSLVFSSEVPAISFLNINDGELIYGVECLVDSLTGQEAEAKDAEERRFEFSFPILTVRTQVFS